MESSTLTTSAKLPSSLNILKSSWQDYKSLAGRFVSMSLILMALNFFCVLLLVGVLVTVPSLFSSVAVGSTILIISFLLLIYLNLWFGLGILSLAVFKDERPTINEVLKRSRPRVLSYLATSAFMFLTILGGSIFIIIPGLVLALYFIFTPYILIKENKSGLNALVASRAYVKDYGWAIFGRVVVMGLIAGIAGILFSTILKSGSLSQSSADLITNIVSSFTLGPISALYITHLYDNLRSFKPKVVDIKPTSNQKVGYTGLALIGLLFTLFYGTWGYRLIADRIGDYKIDDTYVSQDLPV